MRELGRSEYYPWYKKSSAALPQDRFLNVDFLKTEQKRIEHAKEWNKEYRKAKQGDELAEYTTYVIPAKISYDIERPVNGRGFKVSGTSAVRNNLQFPKLALFPSDLNLPPDYSLIRIEEPVKEVVPFKDGKRGEHAIVAKDYEELPIDYIYRGLPSETDNIFEMIEGCLGGDELMTHSVHAPMVSSPGTGTGPGGIGSCSLTQTTRFGETLNSQVARMLPPEYTDYVPPKSDVKGHSEAYSEGKGREIEYITAEKYPSAKSHVGLRNERTYKNILKEAERRAAFTGEYSYLGNVSPSAGKKHHVVQDAVDNFTQNEITITSFDELKLADVDLTRLQDNVNDYEDIWIHFFDARQIMPDVGNMRANREKWVADLQDDWEAFLPQMGYSDVPHQVSELRAEETFKNILRLAQQFARREKREQVSQKDMKDARWNFKAQAERLLDSDVVKQATRDIEGIHTTDRESIVHTFLKSKPCRREELISRLIETGKFTSEKTTERFVQRLLDAGYIYRGQDDKLRAA